MHGEPSSDDPGALALGAAMLLSSHEKLLRGAPRRVRERLFDVGVELCRSHTPDVARGLNVLVDCLPKDERIRSESSLRLAGWLLATGQERAARGILTNLASEHLGSATRVAGSRRWMVRASAASACIEQPKGGRERDWFVSGFCSPRQPSVWVAVGAG
ncbi:MAG: hypothetical protein U0263_39760 [Polyangiaceae bacterium]